MATVTILRRADNKAHTTSVLDDDQVYAGGLVLGAPGSSQTAAALYDDATTLTVSLGAGSSVTTITLGGGGAQTTGNIFNDATMTTLGIGTGMGAGDNITIGGSNSITTLPGDLVVLGTTTSVESEIVNIGDNHLYLNAGYTTASPVTGGLVVNYLPTAVASNVTTGGFTASVTATSNPTVKVVSTTGFAANDLIQVSTANLDANNGLYEVLSVVDATTLKIRNVDGGEGAPLNDFTQDTFTSDSTVAGAVTKVNVSAIRAGASGIWETGIGANGALTFNDLLTAGTVTLQQAYDNGNTITTDATGAVIVAGTQSLQITATNGLDVDTVADFDVTTFDVQMTGTNGFSIDGTDVSNLSTTSAALTVSTLTSGDLNLTGADSVVITGAEAVANAVQITASNAAGGITASAGTGGYSIGSGDTSAQTNVLFTGGTATKANTIGSTAANSTLTLQTGDGAMTFTAGDTFDVNAVDSVTIDSSGGAISVGADDVDQPINIGTQGERTISISTGAFDSTLNIGTGAAVMGITLGSLTTTSSTTIQAGATGDITFDANNMTTPLPFNGTTSGDSGNQDLSSNFTATTLVGVLNELKEGAVTEANSLCDTYITTGRIIGEAVILTANNTANTQTDADALGTSEGFLGVVTTVGASGEVCTHGTATVFFVDGSATPTAGDPIYLARATGGVGIAGAGRVTGTAPTGNPSSDLIVYQIGIMKDNSTLTPTTVGTDELAEIVLQPMQLIEL